ncbi:hypothetical protein [Ramlibacter sp.]|uniref:hypothetical protein n=1 Tax=Ramlibacter sp. TaxID=1917967 RepID=UPI003D114F53
MDATAFHDFHRAICDILRQPAQDMQPIDGVHAFDLAYEGALARVLLLPGAEDRAWVVVDFGVPPPEHELESMLGLAEANFDLLMGEDGARFGRNPDTGVLSLQFPYALEEGPRRLLEKLKTLGPLTVLWPLSLKPGRSADAEASGRSTRSSD